MNKVSKKIVGITGAKGALGSHFIRKYKTKFNFKIYKDRIENKNKFRSWVKKNRNIQYFIHFAAISSIRQTNKDPKKTYKINSLAAIDIIKILNNVKLTNLKYFYFHLHHTCINPL